MDEPLAIVWHRPLPDGCKPSSVTITKDEAERYCVAILVEEDIKALEVTPKMVGLDLGLKSMVITSDGQKNILAVGLTVAACGEAVRPGAVKTKPGKPPRSRNASQ